MKNYFPPNVLNRKWGQAAWGIGLVSVAAALVVSVGCERQQTNTEKTKRSTPQFNAGRSASQTDLDRAAQRFAAGDYAGAIALLQPYLIQHADDAEALRLLAEAYAAQGEFEQAANIAMTRVEQPESDEATLRLQAFNWYLRSGKLLEAEKTIRPTALSDPPDPRALQVLAQLLNAQGRRYEASRFVKTLAETNPLSRIELLSLIDLSGPFQLASFEGVVPESPDVVTLFDLGRARFQLVADGDPQASMATIRRLKERFTTQPAIAAFEGRLLAETSAWKDFEQWLESAPAETEEQPEFWLAVGIWLRHQQRHEEAARAFSEALYRDPTDRQSMRLMAATLEGLGREEQAKIVRERLATLDNIFRRSAQADAQQSFQIAADLQQLVRPWEALGWYRQALQATGELPSRTAELQRRFDQVRQWESERSDAEIAEARLQRLVGSDLNSFNKPELQAVANRVSSVETPKAASRLRFRDAAAEVGVETTFVSDFPIPAEEFYLYQANGGGIGVLDYDLDGRCDLYFSQSGGDPLKPSDSTANQLYRQLSEASAVEVTEATGVGDRGYGQGVAVADLNQDGWPDVLVANIGRNAVFINQGDGTFVKRDDLGISETSSWTSSLGVGDLDGDRLPDVVEVNYLDDQSIFETPCRGRNLACTPQRFRAATDRVFHCNDNGRYELWQDAQAFEDLPNYGFGVVIANFDGQAGNDVFISNDGDVNHFWRSVARNDSFQLRESASLSGLAVGVTGLAQACMGVASGDFDRNGWIDLLITNFHNEPVNLFMQRSAGSFVDESRRFQLAEPTRSSLGFGTQAADYDNDGWLDAAILNGHIYDARYAEIPFQMKPRLFRGGSDGFKAVLPRKDEAYWNQPRLGRTLVTLDWNRDGRIDLVANHLDHPVAMLLNESRVVEGSEKEAVEVETDRTHHWLQIELVGTQSERDAIGAKVTIQAGAESWSGWQTGGDGYMCSNESVLPFGLQSVSSIDNLVIEFPSGERHSFSDVAVNQRYLIVEGIAQLYQRSL